LIKISKLYRTGSLGVKNSFRPSSKAGEFSDHMVRGCSKTCQRTVPAMTPALVSGEAASLQPPLSPHSRGMTRNADDAILKIRLRAAALYGARTCLQAMDLLIAAGDSTIGKQRQHNIDNGASPPCTLQWVARLKSCVPVIRGLCESLDICLRRTGPLLSFPRKRESRRIFDTRSRGYPVHQWLCRRVA